MRRPWGILEERTSAREVVAPLLAIPVVVAGDFQAVFTCVFCAGKPAKASYLPAISAGLGGLGRDISGSTINTLPSSEAPRR
jgi:hypothetical protein